MKHRPLHSNCDLRHIYLRKYVIEWAINKYIELVRKGAKLIISRLIIFGPSNLFKILPYDHNH
jgi:hypothetical protein